MKNNSKANTLLKEFNIYSLSVNNLVGSEVAQLARTALLAVDYFPGSNNFKDKIKSSLLESRVEILAEIDGARPNAPKEDMERISDSLLEYNPDITVSLGEGSSIDAVKSASVIKMPGGNIEESFGTDLVTARLKETGKELHQHCAIQTASGSAVHLTKYSNITDLRTNQKNLLLMMQLFQSSKKIYRKGFRMYYS